MSGVVFPLLGAIVNVAVAWSCVVAGPAPKRNASEIAKKFASDFFGYPDGWPDENDVHSFGFEQIPRNVHDTNTNFNDWHSIVDVRAGWPMFALTGELHGRYAGQMELSLPPSDILFFTPDRKERSYPLPLKPKWGGFVANSILFSIALWILICGPFVPHKIRTASRRRRGVCRKCAYPIGGGDICTECGLHLRRTGNGK